MTQPYRKPPMTAKQHNLIRIKQRELSLPDDILDAYCRQQFNAGFEAIDIRQASELIERMLAWKTLPAELMRLKGQLDLIPEDVHDEPQDDGYERYQHEIDRFDPGPDAGYDGSGDRW